MALDKSEVEKIAHLARLHVDEDEARAVTERITDILGLIDQMQNVDTGDVPPLAHPFEVPQPLRSDQVTEKDERDYFQQLAPESREGLYLVPRVIE